MLLEADGLVKRYGGLVALAGVSLTVEAGEILGVIGPNGAGKTTLFGVISGFVRADGGTCRFKGRNILGVPPNQICRMGIGRTFQLVQPFAGLSVWENVTVAAFNRIPDPRRAQRHARDILAFTGLDDQRDRLARTLTLADQKRLEVARALATGPDLLLLDEVMAGLTDSDVQAILRLIRAVRERGVTVVLIEHRVRALQSLCDRLIVLHHGEKIAEGPPQVVVRDPAVVAAYLGGGAGAGAS